MTFYTLHDSTAAREALVSVTFKQWLLLISALVSSLLARLLVVYR